MPNPITLPLLAAALAQPPDSTASVTVLARVESRPVEGAVVRALDLPGSPAARTDASGAATLRLAAGARALVVTRLGVRPDTLRLALRAGQDTTVTVELEEAEGEVEAVVVSATRSERRVEDTPL